MQEIHMDFGKLAERQIEAAMEAGEFEDLEGAGKPLSALPAGDPLEVFGFKMMAKVGALPREVLLHREIDQQLTLLKTLPEGEPKTRAMAKLAELQMHLAMLMEARR